MLVPARVILYGRNAVREALRGRRSVLAGLGLDGAAREPWLEAVTVAQVDGAELERLCGSPDHQGICAETGPYPYADPESLLAAEDALVVCLDQIQDPQQPRGHLPRAPRAPARPGW